MKKILALSAMVLGLGLAMPTTVVDAWATGNVGSAVVSIVTASEVSVAIAHAESALAATAGAKAGTLVAQVREYLQKWVKQAREVNLTKLSQEQMRELVAALNEGARGLCMMAGIGRQEAAATSVSAANEAKTTAGEATGSAIAAAAGSVAATAAGSVAATAGSVVKATVGVHEQVVGVAKELNTEKELVVEEATSANDEVKASVKAEVAVADSLARVEALAKVQNGSEEDAQEVMQEDEDVEVPATGASAAEEQATSAVRGMGLFLGGAIVLAAAAGTLLIVKRLKR